MLSFFLYLTVHAGRSRGDVVTILSFYRQKIASFYLSQSTNTNCVQPDVLQFKLQSSLDLVKIKSPLSKSTIFSLDYIYFEKLVRIYISMLNMFYHLL